METPRRKIYVAGPYSADTEEGVRENIRLANVVGRELIRKGFNPFIPHNNFPAECSDVSDPEAQALLLSLGCAWLEPCEGIVLLRRWKTSVGAVEEYHRAHQLGLHAFHELEGGCNIWPSSSPLWETVNRWGTEKSTKSTEEHDAIKHPRHYTQGGIEVWDAIVAWGLNYLTGSAVKYLARAGHKPEGDKEKEAEDLRKAIQFINKRIEVLKE